MSITLKPLAEQVMLITGASSGIGLVTARMAAARGAKVMLVARDGDALARIVADIETDGGVAAYIVADVGDADQVDAAADAAIARFGRIDSWVNNAGVAIYAKLVETPHDEHVQLFRTNYFGSVNGCLAAVRHMSDNGGALIQVGSIAADIPTPVMGAYAASKHATKAYFESLRMELVADHVPISLTLIKPSGIATPIAQHAANHVDGEALIPPVIYDPELVAEAILDAAVHPRRSITVGGVGRMQVLLGQHFPGLLDRLGGFMAPMLSDPKTPKTTTDTLFAPIDEGDERGPQSGRRTSFYTAAERHPGAVALVGIAAAAGVTAWLARRR